MLLKLTGLVPLYPLIGCIINGFFGLRIGKNAVGLIAAGSVGLSFLTTLIIFIGLVMTPVEERVFEQVLFTWMAAGDFTAEFGFQVDPLSMTMMLFVTGVGFLIHVYSIGYMHEEYSFYRFFAYMNLFMCSMLLLVMGNNFLLMFIGWEGVGCCSYFLIGYYFEKKSACDAGTKAFVMNRVGDFAFLLAVMYIFNIFGSIDFTTVFHAAPEKLIYNSEAVTTITMLLFIGACGKSAQIPLYTWLPDAMEGPTPVSALIHAATMVAAGVFLVARFFPLFESSTFSMDFIAIIGIITILLSATLGLVMTDIKRVLAYSTVSQLGYMMLALGIGAYVPAIFHLFTHAYFKALLFLGSGNVSHAAGGTFDMRYFGGLRKFMPLTFFAFLIGALSLSGIFPFAGFWSKDEILTNLYSSNHILHNYIFYLALFGTFLTALYMFRVIFLTFYGDFRGGSDKDKNVSHRIPIHLSDPHKLMVFPIILLAISTIIFGYLVNPTTDILFLDAHWFSNFLQLEHSDHHHVSFSFIIALISTLFASAGIFSAYILYYKNNNFISQIKYRLKYVHTVLENKYFIDYLYEKPGKIDTTIF